MTKLVFSTNLNVNLVLPHAVGPAMSIVNVWRSGRVMPTAAAAASLKPEKRTYEHPDE